MNIRQALRWIGMVFLSSTLTGCFQHTYPGDQLKEAISKICVEEYNIPYVDVKVAGTTIGVFLPLKKLFAADFKEAVVAGKVRNLDSLLEPSPEALEKIEDVLFAISRVILSTDRNLEFYTLQAADTEKTGMQLVLYGFVDDIKRVRLWDISRDEYRRRIVHELKPNRPAKWHQPVRQFFDDLSHLSAEDIQLAYFGKTAPQQAIQSLFFNRLLKKGEKPGLDSKWRIKEIRSTPVQKNQTLVYVKAIPAGAPIAGLTGDLQYLFLLSGSDEAVHITRIVPFQYLDEKGQIHKAPFPKELGIEANLQNWEEEFTVKPIILGKFLAEQITRRSQGVIAGDERMANTFRDIKMEFQYRMEAQPHHFYLQVEASLVDFNNYASGSTLFHEDMLYFLSLVLKEFNHVIRSYHFEDFDSLHLKMVQEPSVLILNREKLERFRNGEINIQTLLATPGPDTPVTSLS